MNRLREALPWYGLKMAAIIDSILQSIILFTLCQGKYLCSSKVDYREGRKRTIIL